MKKFQVVIKSPNGDIVVHSGQFNAESSDIYRVHISPLKGRHSLVVQEVKKAINSYEDYLLKCFNSMPNTLKQKLSRYLPIEQMEFGDFLRMLNNQVTKKWKI